MRLAPGIVALLASAITLNLWVPRGHAAEKEERKPTGAAFSSDAMLIVYVDEVTPPGEILPTTSELWTVFSNGQGKQRLTTGHRDFNPHFSPDGKSIVFQRDLDGEIWMIPTAGGTPRNVTNTPEVREKEAQFSNDGESLFLIAPAPTQLTANALEKELLVALGMGQVLVQLNLKDGTRRQLLGEDYRIQHVVIDPDDDKLVLAIAKAVEADGKPTIFGDDALIAVPLDGSAPHTVYAPPKGYDLDDARSGGSQMLLSSAIPGEFSKGVLLLKKASAKTATAADLKKLDKFAFLGDLSLDGKTVLGTAITSGIDHWGLMTYDVASEKWTTVLED